MPGRAAMLPVTSAADTYRAGFWALRRNAALCCAWIVLYTGYQEALGVWYLRLLLGKVSGLGVPVLVATSWIIGFLLIALLAVPLHASFLSDGRVTGVRALADGAVVCRVAWRGFLIVIAAAIPTVLLFMFGDMLLNGALTRALAALGHGAPSPALLFGFRAIVLTLFGLATVLLGLGIPRAVALGRAGTLGGSIRWGLRFFRPMAGRLAAGPCLVSMAVAFMQWRVLVDIKGAFDPLWPFAHLSASMLIAYATFVLCMAMIAGILSDAFRRAQATAAPQ